MRKSLEYNIILFVFIILFITTLANTGMDVYGFRSDYINAMTLRTQSIGQAMKSSVEKILVLGIELKDISGMDEKCRDMVASNPEISYTLITAPDGNILHSNDQAFANLIFPAQNPGTPKNSTSRIENASGAYFDTSTPVKSFDGKITGYIHVGFPQKNIDSKVLRMALRSGGIFIFFFLISFALLVFFIKKNIIKPIGSLLLNLNKISEGDFKISIPDLPTNELKELGVKIEKMAEAISTRDNELRNSFIELATTHGRLAESYQQLEELSQQLEKSEKLYKSLLEDAGDAIIVLDKNETVAIVNKKALELLGYPQEELLNKHLFALFIMLKVKNIPEQLEKFKNVTPSEPISEEISITTKSNDQVIVRIQTSLVKAGGQALLQMIVHDVTSERKLLNNLERSTNELEKLNKMKDSFIGVASHEIKTPLTIIIGYSELLLNDMQTTLPSDAIEMIENISNASNRLNNIVRDMIDVSMIDRKNIALDLQAININQLLEQSAKEHRVFFAARKQTITLDLDKSVPLIHADRDRLMQLMSNLISNAIKFTPDEKAIKITTQIRELIVADKFLVNHPVLDHLNAAVSPKIFIEIAVYDTGIGIDKDDQLRIFDKFYEAGNIDEHSTGKTAFKAGGAGLGLAISKGIVEIHGGKIWVESSGYDPINCNGSTFFVLLPLDQFQCDGKL